MTVLVLALTLASAGALSAVPLKTAKTWGPKTFVRDHVTIAGQLPAYLGAYVGPKAALAPKLTEAIMLTMNSIDACPYCTGLHGELARMAGTDEETYASAPVTFTTVFAKEAGRGNAVDAALGELKAAEGAARARSTRALCFALLWGKATGCPLWNQDRIRKKDKVTGEYTPWPLDKKGKAIKIRSNRVLSSTTLKTLASGSAGAVSKQLHEEARALRCDTSAEVEKFPMQPAFGVGASMEVEAAFVAYIQEIFRTAVDIKSAVGKHSKVSAKSMQAAADIVNRKIAATTGFMPPLVTSRHPLKRKRSSKKKEAVKEAAKA